MVSRCWGSSSSLRTQWSINRLPTNDLFSAAVEGGANAGRSYFEFKFNPNAAASALIGVDPTVVSPGAIWII
jgi:hypothetical protein